VIADVAAMPTPAPVVFIASKIGAALGAALGVALGAASTAVLADGGVALVTRGVDDVAFARGVRASAFGASAAQVTNAIALTATRDASDARVRVNRNCCGKFIPLFNEINSLFSNRLRVPTGSTTCRQRARGAAFSCCCC
jgi:hypothetical protein